MTTCTIIVVGHSPHSLVGPRCLGNTLCAKCSPALQCWNLTSTSKQASQLRQRTDPRYQIVQVQRGPRNTLPCENHLPSLIFLAVFSPNSFIFLKNAALDLDDRCYCFLCFIIFFFSSSILTFLALRRTEICILLHWFPVPHVWNHSLSLSLLFCYLRSIRIFAAVKRQTMKTHMFSSRLWPPPLKSDRNCLAWEACHIYPFCDENSWITGSVFNLSEKWSHPDIKMQIN